MSPHGSSSAIKHVFYYIHIASKKKKADVSKTILLDKCWLNKAKTNLPLISSELLGPGHCALRLMFPVCAHPSECVTPLGVQDTIWFAEEVLSKLQVVNHYF